MFIIDSIAIARSPHFMLPASRVSKWDSVGGTRESKLSAHSRREGFRQAGKESRDRKLLMSRWYLKVRG